MQPIEGFTPGMLWTAMIVAVGLAGLIVLWDKVRAVFAGVRQRKQSARPELADEISQKVLERLEPRFSEIERKLANDNVRIDAHTRQIDSMQEGQKAQCRGILALLNHEITGNSVEKLKEAQQGINEYLIEK